MPKLLIIDFFFHLFFFFYVVVFVFFLFVGSSSIERSSHGFLSPEYAPRKNIGIRIFLDGQKTTREDSKEEVKRGGKLSFSAKLQENSGSMGISV